LGKKGIKYYRKGANPKIKVGFFYFELVLNLLEKHPKGKSVKEISKALDVNYQTVRHIVNKLTEMNRLNFDERKTFNGPPVKYYSVTKWRLN